MISDKGKSIILGNIAVQQQIVSLQKCLVASLASPSLTDEEIVAWISEWGVLGSVHVSRMDLSHALVSFGVPEEASRLLFELPTFHESPFSNLCFWSKEWDLVSCWIRVSGIPLRAWFNDSILAIGNFLGKVVEIDPSTSSGRNLQFMRFRVAFSPDLAEIKRIPLKVGVSWYDLIVEIEDSNSVCGMLTPPLRLGLIRLR